MQEIVYHINYELENSYWWFVARKKILRDLIQRYCLFNNETNLLDVGCGTGGFASFISQYCNVICLDTSDLALSYCKKRGLNNLYQGTLEEFNTDNNKIQIISMLDVVEHIENDKRVIERAYELLEENGCLIITVPAYKWLWSEHDEIHMHKRRYTKKEIVKLIESAGFKIVFATYFNFFLFPTVALMRIIEILLKTKKKIERPVVPVPTFINIILEKIFSLEKYFLKFFKFPFGLSILIIAKK